MLSFDVIERAGLLSLKVVGVIEGEIMSMGPNPVRGVIGVANVKRSCPYRSCIRASYVGVTVPRAVLSLLRNIHKIIWPYHSCTNGTKAGLLRRGMYKLKRYRMLFAQCEH